MMLPVRRIAVRIQAFEHRSMCGCERVFVFLLVTWRVRSEYILVVFAANTDIAGAMCIACSRGTHARREFGHLCASCDWRRWTHANDEPWHARRPCPEPAISSVSSASSSTAAVAWLGVGLGVHGHVTMRRTRSRSARHRRSLSHSMAPVVLSFAAAGRCTVVAASARAAARLATIGPTSTTLHRRQSHAEGGRPHAPPVRVGHAGRGRRYVVLMSRGAPHGARWSLCAALVAGGLGCVPPPPAAEPTPRGASRPPARTRRWRDHVQLRTVVSGLRRRRRPDLEGARRRGASERGRPLRSVLARGGFSARLGRTHEPNEWR